MTELKPCPFCGQLPQVQEDFRYPWPERERKRTMPKYIDAEAVKAAVSAYCDKTKPCSTVSVMGLIPDVVIHDVLDIIDEAPAADVTQVVKCMDCCMHNKCYVEEVFELSGTTEGFCYAGKRREYSEIP